MWLMDIYENYKIYVVVICIVIVRALYTEKAALC